MCVVFPLLVRIRRGSENRIFFLINPFLAVSIFYPLKARGNIRCSNVFREYKMRTLARNRLMVLEKRVFEDCPREIPETLPF